MKEYFEEEVFWPLVGIALGVISITFEIKSGLLFTSSVCVCLLFNILLENRKKQDKVKK